jgi:ankyrin repeat protein
MGRHATAPWSAKFFSKQSMLDIVAEKGFATIFELILKSKRDENNLGTALRYAASGGHVEIIKAVLKRNKDTAGMTDHKGQTALHWAALRDHEQIVEVLLAVNPNLAIVQDAKGWTALHLAAMRGDDDVVHKLLEHNVSAAESRDKEEKTPLDWARRWRRDTVVNILPT